ncbi:MAG: hypothetical protein ACYTGC_03700 [Planctomycetota bacterium]|jgi:hypothetical protein
MARRFWPLRIVPLLGALALANVLGGCTSSNRVEFMNASDTWVNVRVFVADSGQASEPMTMDEARESTPNSGQFVSESMMQVKPGGTMTYALSKNPYFASKGSPLIHVQVEPVTPSWMPPARQFWLELLTPPPVTIVTTGTGDSLKFNTGEGAVAVIPNQEVEGGRFDHKVVASEEGQQ